MLKTELNHGASNQTYNISLNSSCLVPVKVIFEPPVLFTEFFATTILYKILSNLLKQINCVCQPNLKNMFDRRGTDVPGRRMVSYDNLLDYNDNLRDYNLYHPKIVANHSSFIPLKYSS